MKKIIMSLFSIAFLISLTCASAIDNEIHLNIQTLNDTTQEVINGTFNFVFNISTKSDCSNSIYSKTFNSTTTPNGVTSFYLNNISINFTDQYWLRYSRDGVLKNCSKIARNPYSFTAKNVSSSGIYWNSNLNLGDYNVTTTGKGIFGALDLVTSGMLLVMNFITNDNSGYLWYSEVGDSFIFGNANVLFGLDILVTGNTTIMENLSVNGNANFEGNVTVAEKITADEGYFTTKLDAGSLDPYDIQYKHDSRPSIIFKYERWACQGVAQTVEFYNVETGKKELYYPLEGSFKDAVTYQVLETIAKPRFNNNCKIVDQFDTLRNITIQVTKPVYDKYKAHKTLGIQN